MTLVWLAIALWAVVIISRICAWLVDRFSGPRTDFDRRCSAIDAELDELEARRRTRPTGNCDVIRFPRERTRGDVA